MGGSCESELMEEGSKLMDVDGSELMEEGLKLMEEGSELLDVDRSRQCWGANVRSWWCLDEQSTHRRVEGARTAI